MHCLYAIKPVEHCEGGAVRPMCFSRSRRITGSRPYVDHRPVGTTAGRSPLFESGAMLLNICAEKTGKLLPADAAAALRRRHAMAAVWQTGGHRPDARPEPSLLRRFSRPRRFPPTQSTVTFTEGNAGAARAVWRTGRSAGASANSSPAITRSPNVASYPWIVPHAATRGSNWTELPASGRAGTEAVHGEICSTACLFAQRADRRRTPTVARSVEGVSVWTRAQASADTADETEAAGLDRVLQGERRHARDE